MTGPRECRHVRTDLGVYLLGAIDAGEWSVVDAHLASCPDCRTELAGLAALPALLGRVSRAEAAAIAGADAPPQPGDSLTPLLARAARDRRMRRWRGAAAAAAAALIVAGAAVGLVRAASPHVPWEFDRASADGRAALVGYAAEPGGTQLEARVSGIRPGTTCEFVVLGAGGWRYVAGSWTVTGGSAGTWYYASAAVPVGQVAGFEITWGTAVLVRLRV